MTILYVVDIMAKLKESFEWLSKPEDLPKDRLLKIVAKTPSPEGTTIHLEDKDYPVRIFKEEEINKNARSLIGTVLGWNHESRIVPSYVVDTEYNKEEKQLEALAFVPESIIEKVKKGEIKQASIEYDWRGENKTEDGIEFEGLRIFRVDLLDKEHQAGDKNTQVSLFEAKERTGRILGEMKLEEGCVWATQWDSPEACIAANQDKADPSAYCYSKVESKKEDEPVDTTPSTEELKEALKTYYETIKKLKEDEVIDTTPSVPETVDNFLTKEPEPEMVDPLDTGVCPEGYEEIEVEGVKRCKKVLPATDETKKGDPATGIEKPTGGATTPTELKNPSGEVEKELREAMQRVLKENKKLKKSQSEVIENARTEAVEEVLERIKEIVPDGFIVSRFNLGARRFVEDIRKVILEFEEE